VPIKVKAGEEGNQANGTSGSHESTGVGFSEVERFEELAALNFVALA
jgi:hypothetical protein